VSKGSFPAVESADSPVRSPADPELTAGLSALLAEMVRTEAIPVGVAACPEVRPGGTLGRLRVIRELGRGGFGVVLEAEDDRLGRRVAVKVLRPGTRIAAHAKEWLEREARAVAGLNHANIVTLHDLGMGPAGPYLVFELLEGEGLDARLARGPLTLAEALAIALDVARALVHAHAQGVVHRDLKPPNVFLAPDGRAKVLDFGLAHLFGRGGSSGGTPAYMAPEQWTGGGDARSDLFALGVILFELLGGRRPYRAEKGFSEAQEPGPTPALPRGAAPARLRRLVRGLIERDPARRPQDAREVRDALLAIRRGHAGRVRRRVVGASLAAALLATATATWQVVTREPPAGEQVRAVLAAMENVSGEPALDAAPGLLVTALAPSRRVRLVAPARLAQLAREAKLPDAPRIDAERGRALARIAGAAVVLAPSARRDGRLNLVEVRAVEAESGRTLFVASASVERADDLAGAVDEVADRVRAELAERAADRKVRRPVAQAVTSSAEAAKHYYEGLDCLATRHAAPSASAACATHFEAALANDPGFALAHYQLAVVMSPQGASPESWRPHVDAALRSVDRLPAHEAVLVRALAARHGGRFDEAARLYDRAIAEAPDEPATLVAAADLEIARGEWGAALRYLEKLVGLEPVAEEPIMQLLDALGRLGRREDLRDLGAAISTESHSPRRSQALVVGSLWLGDPERALAHAREAVAERGQAEARLLRLAATTAGDFGTAEAQARVEASANGGAPRYALNVARALVGQGRVADALRTLDEAAARGLQLSRGAAHAEQEAGYRFTRAMLLAARWDAAAVAREAVRAAALDGVTRGALATTLAVLGDGAGSAALVPDATGRVGEVLGALRTARAGDTSTALARLAVVEASDPAPVLDLPPSYLAAEIASAAGEHREALAAVARFRRLPAYGTGYGWVYLRSVLIAARAHHALGDDASARREVDRLLAMLAHADRDLPLLRDAKSLRASLRAG
jgi:eukaryotic-like serine/threonine-protein kinase